MNGAVELFGFPEAEADGQSLVDGAHGALVELAHALAQAGFVDGADLLKQNDAVAVEAGRAAGELDVRRQLGLAHLARDRRGDDGGAVAVAGVVLDDQHRAHPALFASDHRAEVGKIDSSASNHVVSHSVNNSPKPFYVGC